MLIRTTHAPDDSRLERRLERARLLVVLITVAVNVLAVAALTKVPWSNWRTGLGLNLIDNAILIGFAILWRDRLMARLILFGLIVGFLELPTDAWIVDVSRTLDYSIGGGPMIWRSPAWMPLAWEVVAVQFGYIGMRLFERYGFTGILLTAVLGAVNIPYYEEMALRINWWRYHDAAMFPHTHTPWAIIMGEFLIAGQLAYFARWCRRKSLRWTIILGIVAGAGVFVGYAAPDWMIRHCVASSRDVSRVLRLFNYYSAESRAASPLGSPARAAPIRGGGFAPPVFPNCEFRGPTPARLVPTEQWPTWLMGDATRTPAELPASLSGGWLGRARSLPLPAGRIVRAAARGHDRREPQW